MKINLPKNFFFKLGNPHFINKIVTAVTFLLTVILISSGNYIWKGQNIQIGTVSTKKYIANTDTINPIATSQKQEEVRKKAVSGEDGDIVKKYSTDSSVGIEAVEKIQSFFNTVRTAKANEEEKLLQEKLKQEQEESRQNESTEESSNSDITVDNSNLLDNSKNNETETSYSYNFPIDLNSTQLDLLIALNSEQIDNLEKNLLQIVTRTLGLGVEQDKLNDTLINLKAEIESIDQDSKLNEILYSLTKSVVKPNRILDEDDLKNQIDHKVAQVEPVLVLKGEKIVDENEIITKEIYAILDNLGYIEKNQIDSKIIFPVIGICIIVLLMQTFVYEYIRTNNSKLWSSTKEKLMLFTIYCIIIVTIKLMSKVPYMIIPIQLSGMLVAMLIDLPLGIIINLVVSIVSMFMYNGSVDFLIYFIISGTFACMLTRYTYARSNTIKAAISISIVNAVIILGTGFLVEQTYNEQLILKSSLGILNGFITLIIVIGSLPFWEIAFDAITPIKLFELTNPNQPILKKLIIEAPGTYHHSIIVANLAEMAAMNIGANEALARAGAYYHDIGKLKYPNYFSENQAGENPHDYLLPLDSAKIIIEHVQAGQEYAENENLPKSIKDMISQHHGNTLVKYFYYKAKKDFPEEDINEQNYRYPGPIPQTKEAAILMLADTVEAAVRSMFSQGKSMDEIKVIVGNLIKDKLDDGQLKASGLTINDLDTIQNSFLKVFKGMYHGRIAYPKEAMKSRLESKKTDEEKAK